MEKISKRDWKQVIKEYKQSGLSAKHYCKQHDIGYSTLTYHLRKEKQQKGTKKINPGSFVQIPLKSQSTEEMKPEIILTMEKDVVKLQIRMGS